MFHSQPMAPYFVLPRKHDKFEFKTTIERNGIVLARPCAKIVKKSRNSKDKIMQSKAIARTRRDHYENTEDNENKDYDEDNYEPSPTYSEYITYCILENSGYSYGDDFDDFEDFQFSFADYCYLQTQTPTPTPKPQKKYSPPKIRPDSDVEVFHWPKVVYSPRLTYAQMAM
jgi:hypothetical protein